jgi:hypothetical protein
MNLANYLTYAPDPRLRDPMRAIEMAKKALEMDPEKAEAHVCLGEVLYSAGNQKGVLEAFRKGLEDSKGGTNEARFLLAMAHWRLGNKEEARQCYDQAVQGREKNQSRNPQVQRRLRDQAADLLGIKQSPAAPRELRGPPKPVDDSHSSLDLIDGPARVAGDKTAMLAVHEQIQDFEDNSADQGTLALRFHNRREGIAPTQELDVSPSGPATLCPAPIGVPDTDRVRQLETQLIDRRLGQHEHSRTGVHPAGDRLSPDLVGAQMTMPSQLHIARIDNLEFDSKTSHAVGSFRSHAAPPFGRSSLNGSADWIIVPGVLPINLAESLTTKDTKNPEEVPERCVLFVLFVSFVVRCHRRPRNRNQ